MATNVTVSTGEGSTQVTVITGEGTTSYTVNAGSRGPAGLTGAAGATGATGAAGPNTITTATTTPLVGFLSGNGATVTASTSATFVSSSQAYFESGSQAYFESGSQAIFDGGSATFVSGSQAYFESGSEAIFVSGSQAYFVSGSLANFVNGTIKLAGTSFTSSLNFTAPTSAKTITLPDATGTVALTDDPRFTDARTPLAHTHGNISNVGAIGSTATLPLITTTAGVITTGTFGTTAGTFTQGNDSRLSDARTPLAHTHVVSDIVSIASHHLIGRHAGATGAAQEVHVGNGIEFQSNGIRRSALTGDVTASAGSNVTTLAGTIEGNKTFSGNISLTSTSRPTSSGTDNPAATSLITRDDYLAQIHKTVTFDHGMGSAAAANSGLSNSDRGYWNLLTTTSTTSQARLAFQTNLCALGLASDFLSLDRAFTIRANIAVQQGTPRALHKFFLQIGRPVATSTYAQLTSAQKGFGIGIENGTVTPFVGNGTAITNGTTFSHNLGARFELRWIPASGLYIYTKTSPASELTLVSQITTGLPTGTTGSWLEFISFEAGSSTAALRYVIFGTSITYP